MTRLIRLVSAVAIVVVLGRDLHYVLLHGQQRLGDYLSFFTHLSSIAAALVLLSLGLFPHLSNSVPFSWIRGTTTLSMCCTGLFFILVTASPVAFLKHSIGPLVMVIDWVRDRPRNLNTRLIASWSIAPAAYLIYTLVRGAMIDWYPYSLIDPRVGGYVRVTGVAAVMAVCSGITSSLLASVVPGQPGWRVTARLLRLRTPNLPMVGVGPRRLPHSGPSTHRWVGFGSELPPEKLFSSRGLP
jgi:hypothetical protein